jgi:hypothetical protein
MPNATNRLFVAGLLIALVPVPGAQVSMATDLKLKANPVGPVVTVYVKQDNLVVAELGRAQRTATGIFASFGVGLQFRAGGQPKSAGEGAIRIELQLGARTPAQFHPGAMAYAMPFGASGTRIHIFCDRVRNTQPDGGSGTILGYVMAHEIAHVLQGVSRHSAEGVMKAHWEIPDYGRMKKGTLAFDPTDVELIREALEKVTTQSARAEPAPR